MGWSLKKPFNFGKVNILNTLASAVAPGVGQYLGTVEANKTNETLTRETNALNQANWDKQTAYNSPVENMKRLEAAGLNPQLAYGQIAESKMASAPAMEAPKHQAATFGDGIMPQLAAYSQVLNNQEMNKKLRLENEYTAYEINKLKNSGMLRSDAGQLRFWERLPSLVGDRIQSMIRSMEETNERNYQRQLQHKEDRIRLEKARQR